MYLRPAEIDEALNALSARAFCVLAGGTDFYPQRVGRPIVEDVLDITALPDLRGIGWHDDFIGIGALTTWAQIAAAQLPGWMRGLQLAAREVGGVQIQNAGTIAGNLCNASPAADGVPALLALDAQVELRSAGGMRRLPLQDFIVGNRRTQRRGDELLTRVILPARSATARSTFLKLGARRYLVISIAMVAATLETDAAGNIAHAAIAVGSCSEVAQRLPALEAALRGQRLGPQLARLPLAAHVSHLKPLTDIRGTAQYRLDAALTLVRRALEELAHE
jgi:CO/xanthine dehydrogenase FAD-binding subunit